MKKVFFSSHNSKKTGEELSAEKFAETLFKLLYVLKFFYIQKVFECAQLNITNQYRAAEISVRRVKNKTKRTSVVCYQSDMTY